MTLQSNLQTPGGPLRRAVFIGASAGGVFAILELAAALRANFPVPMFFVQHIGAHRSEIALLMNARGPNFAVEARDGDLPAAGSIHVAPPDHHMLLEGGLIWVVRGPKEHHARPAIDPLFRSAALELGVGAIGVVLTGMLDDGSAACAPSRTAAARPWCRTRTMRSSRACRAPRWRWCGPTMWCRWQAWRPCCWRWRWPTQRTTPPADTEGPSPPTRCAANTPWAKGRGPCRP